MIAVLSFFLSPLGRYAAIGLVALALIGGAYLNPATRKLYIAAPQADLAGGFQPLVHVFQVI